jgi:hypothetical protein
MVVKTICGSEVLLDDEDASLFEGISLWVSSEGYIKGYIKGEQVYVHRLVMKAKPGEWVDHKVGSKLDCRKSELRISTRAQNLWNRGKSKHNTSGYKGVYLCNRTGRWRVEIRANNVRYRLGRYDDPAEAAKVYDKKALELHAEFACLNFPYCGD